MIAYCGINCDECPSYKGTITGDETLLLKMKECVSTRQEHSRKRLIYLW